MQLENRTIDDYGNVSFKIKDLYPLIQKGFDVSKLLVEDGPEYQQLYEVASSLDNEEIVPPKYVCPTETLDECMNRYRTTWLIPERYKILDLRVWLNEKCTTPEERDRVKQEMAVFERYELEDMLRSLVYLVDIFRKHKIVWGIGRGSSVSSFVLYLIGIHRVNSIAYDLDFSEFLN